MAAEPLTSLPSVKNFLAVTDGSKDAKFSALLFPASQMVRQYLGFEPLSSGYTDEVYDGNGSGMLFLKNRPITAVAGLYLLDYSESDPVPQVAARSAQSGFWFDDKALYVRGFSFSYGRQNVFVSYTAGWDPEDLPPDIEAATNMTVAVLDSAGSIDVNVMSENVPGAYTATFRPDAGRLPDNAKALLSPYRRVSML